MVKFEINELNFVDFKLRIFLYLNIRLYLSNYDFLSESLEIKTPFVTVIC